MVFDSVVSATMKKTSYGGPFVSELGMSSDDGVVFVGSKRTVLDLRRELVAPPQPA